MEGIQLTAEELFAALARGERPVLLDVREPWEHELARLPGSVLVPLGELSERVGELDPSAEMVVYCHHGVRSLHALGLLRSLGFIRASNLVGGIDACSDLDPSIPRY